MCTTLTYFNIQKRLLEIGVFDGASLKLWGNLFPNHGKIGEIFCSQQIICVPCVVLMYHPCLFCTLMAEKIVGLGYGLGGAVAKGFKNELTSKLSIYTGDQSDVHFLKQMKVDLNHEQFDIIIDDGSHVPWHQLFTFEIMFDTWLKPGGLYIIEDVETSYWDGSRPKIYGYDIINAGMGKKGSVVEKFKVLVAEIIFPIETLRNLFSLQWMIDVLNRKFIDSDPAFSIFTSEVDHLVSHIAFSENCIIIWKRSPPGLETEWDMVAKSNNANFSRKRKPGVLRMFTRKTHQEKLPRGKHSILSRLATSLWIFLFG